MIAGIGRHRFASPFIKLGFIPCLSFAEETDIFRKNQEESRKEDACQSGCGMILLNRNVLNGSAFQIGRCTTGNTKSAQFPLRYAQAFNK